MTRHVSKQDRLIQLLDEIKNKTTRNNVDLVLPLLQWNITKLDLIIAADEKKQEAKKAKEEKKRPSLPLLVARGEIWQAHLGQNIGSEQNECRPVLIIQNEANNRRSPNTIVAPLTDLGNRLANKGNLTEEQIIEDARSKLRETEVLLPQDCVIEGQPKLNLPSILLCQNIRELSKERLTHKITRIHDSYWIQINNAISKSLGLA